MRVEKDKTLFFCFNTKNALKNHITNLLKKYIIDVELTCIATILSVLFLVLLDKLGYNSFDVSLKASYVADSCQQLVRELLLVGDQRSSEQQQQQHRQTDAAAEADRRSS